jgi:hypothetical protein
VKKLEELAKKINELIHSNDTVKEYLELKKNIENDEKLVQIREQLDALRKEICKDKSKDSSEYFDLLSEYKNNCKIMRYEALKEKIGDLSVKISDILSLN